ncbi:MAG: LL-diaminopimelate aminotransferase [Xenococcaceae cyanobacterium]
MVSKNSNFNKLFPGKTFARICSEKIINKVKSYRCRHPDRPIFMMTYGNTSHPIPHIVTQSIIEASNSLGHWESYSGYGEVTGNLELKKAISYSYYKENLGVNIEPADIFVSDGAQSVLVNLLELFSQDSLVALPNPGYPAFIEGTLLSGRRFINLNCLEKNNFIPHIPQEKVDIIYLQFPGNPTGAVATFEQLKQFVNYANENNSVIIFDAAYSAFIVTDGIPRSIYEIDGSKECSIEVNSFSKMAGFAGLRVGWSVIPQNLTIEDTVIGELNSLWEVRHEVKFWGACNIAQHGATAALSKPGFIECQKAIKYYLENASLVRKGIAALGWSCFGGINNPFIWVKAPKDMTSWQLFDMVLGKVGIVGTPGSIFGSCGEGFLRISALGRREEIERAFSCYW